MKQLKSICLLLMLALVPLQLMANEQKEEGEALNIPEIVLEHLADAKVNGALDSTIGHPFVNLAMSLLVEEETVRQRMSRTEVPLTSLATTYNNR